MYEKKTFSVSYRTLIINRGGDKANSGHTLECDGVSNGSVHVYLHNT